MPIMRWKGQHMTPDSVMSDLIYVERYHRTHGAPMTAEVLTRARALIYQQMQALGLMPVPKGQAVMTILVSDYEQVYKALIQAHKALVQVYDRPNGSSTRMDVYEALGVCREAIYKPPKTPDN